MPLLTAPAWLPVSRNGESARRLAGGCFAGRAQQRGAQLRPSAIRSAAARPAMSATPRLSALRKSRCLPACSRFSGRDASCRLPLVLPKQKCFVSRHLGSVAVRSPGSGHRESGRHARGRSSSATVRDGIFGRPGRDFRSERWTSTLRARRWLARALQSYAASHLTRAGADRRGLSAHPWLVVLCR